MKKIPRKSRGTIRGDERRNRSEVPLEAARLYLESVAGRCEAQALALGTYDGLLIAGTRGDLDLDTLSAIGAACVRGESEHEAIQQTMDDVMLGQDIFASLITIGDQTFHLTSVGARVPSVKAAQAALSRILSSELSAG